FVQKVGTIKTIKRTTLANLRGSFATGKAMTVPIGKRQRIDTDATPSLSSENRVTLNVAVQGIEPFEADVLEQLLKHQLRPLIHAAREKNAEAPVAQLLDAILPSDPLANVHLKIAEGTVALRQEFLDREKVLMSDAVHKNAGFPGGNPSQTVHRWRKQG